VVYKSNARQHATFTEAQMHQVLRYASLEVISHIAIAGNDITINNSDPTPQTIDC